MTDAKGSRVERGWVFFDRDCKICTATARRFRGPLEARGFGLAALQDPRASALLRIPEAQTLEEMRMVTSDGKLYGGADAIIYLARRIWWAWPLYAAARWLGARPLMVRGYRRFAAHRKCLPAGCEVTKELIEKRR